MAGKYNKLKGKLTAFSQDATYQQQLDKLKKRTPVPLSILQGKLEQVLRDKSNHKIITPLSMRLADLADAWDRVRALKDKMDEYSRACAHMLDAISQVMVDKMEDADATSQSFGPLGTFYLKDTPYPSVEDRAALVKWMKKNKMEDILTVNYKTLEGIVNERLIEGKTVPAGVKVFMKTTLARRK